MTDPAGEMFLSYKHTHSEAAEILVDSLHEYGVPVWRDETDMRSEGLESGLEDVILDRNRIAGGILLLSDDVAESDVILDLELPCFRKRLDTNDDFFVVIVRCPDVTVDRANTILRESSAVHDFSEWYLKQLSDITVDEADVIADFVLSERIRRLHKNLDDGDPIRCSLDTYEPPAHNPRTEIVIDWSHHFESGLPPQEIWNQRLVPTLLSITAKLNQFSPSRSVEFCGRCHLPASFALGWCLRSTRGIEAYWMQSDATGTTEPWGLGIDSESCNFNAAVNKKSVTNGNLGVFVSVTGDVTPEVGSSKSRLPELGCTLEIVPESGPGSVLSAGEAVAASTVFRDEVRSTANDLPNVSLIHLFMASPVGLAFLMGQQTNTLRPIQTYLLDSSTGKYRKAALLPFPDDNPIDDANPEKSRLKRAWDAFINRSFGQ